MIFLAMFAAAIAAGVAGGGGDLQVGGLGARSVIVVDSAHRIDFPDRIRFSVEAVAPDDVESVRLFYTIGPRATEIYTYPTVIRRAETLRALFTVETGADRFIPQGVDIEYSYGFTDSNGVEVRSDRYSFEYLDPRYRWRRIEAEDFVLLWHDRRTADVRALVADASHRLGHVKQLFGVEERQRFKAVLVNGRREANRSFPTVSGTSRDAALYGGFAFGRYDALVLAGASPDGLIHELSHLMLDEAIDSPRARIPAWLNEGLAMYFERGGQYREADVRRAMYRGDLFRLRHMGSMPGRPDDVRLFYSQSASVVRFLIDRYGEARMQGLLSEIGRGRSINAALTTAYGFGVDELDNSWRSAMSERTSVTQIVDPGTLGTSVIIAGAVAVTGVALGVAWLKQRRDRVDEDVEDIDVNAA